METYGIASLLEPEHRQRAAQAVYVTDGCGSTRTQDGICPMGVAFGLGYSPGPEGVAEILAQAGGHDYVGALDAAESFTGDVDSGLIGPDDVAAALGEARPSTTGQGEGASGE